MLKLNDSKTEFMVISPKHLAHNVPQISSLRVGDTDVQAVSSAKNIGVIMDKHLTMKDHVNTLCKASYMQLRNIGKIRKYLTDDSAATMIHSFVTSRLDSLNALLYGLPDCILKRLQLIQNQAAKIVTRKKKHDHVTPLLISLHWLPIQHRIRFKILLLAHKCLHGKAPRYLSSLLEVYVPTRALRSSEQFLLKVKKARLKTYGHRAFSVAAPPLWNELPEELRKCENEDVFKNRLKTVIFKQAFNV